MKNIYRKIVILFNKVCKKKELKQLEQTSFSYLQNENKFSASLGVKPKINTITLGIIQALVESFEDFGAINNLTFTVVSPFSIRAFDIVIQDHDGITLAEQNKILRDFVNKEIDKGNDEARSIMEKLGYSTDD